MNNLNIKDYLQYYNETGNFIWIKSTKTNKPLHKKAGSITTNGYLIIRFNKTRYYAHRLAWFFIYGNIPNNQIDHINGITNDNSINNLRLCSDSTNRLNTGMWKTNTTGYKGVTYSKSRNKYVAQATLQYKHYTLGYFDTAKEASNKYQEFAKNNHGEFYRKTD